MKPLQQLREGVVIVIETKRHRTLAERAAKRGGNSGLVRQAVYTDDSAFHVMLGCGVLFEFYGHQKETTLAAPVSFVAAGIEARRAA